MSRNTKPKSKLLLSTKSGMSNYKKIKSWGSYE